MSYRLTIECETFDEVRVLAERLAGSMTVPTVASRSEGNGRVFRERDVRALSALAVSAQGMTTDQLAQALGVPNASLPPIINGWNRRARWRGLSVDHLFAQKRESSSDGRPVTRYHLTEEGKRMLEEETDTIPVEPQPGG